MEGTKTDSPHTPLVGALLCGLFQGLLLGVASVGPSCWGQTPGHKVAPLPASWDLPLPSQWSSHSQCGLQNNLDLMHGMAWPRKDAFTAHGWSRALEAGETATAQPAHEGPWKTSPIPVKSHSL